jgi:hypothetical protein
MAILRAHFFLICNGLLGKAGEIAISMHVSSEARWSTGCRDCYLTLPLRSAKITIEYRCEFKAGRHDTLPLLE